jgi:aspartate kinase
MPRLGDGLPGRESSMIVLKFGGTSVGGADPIQRVGRIVQSVLARDPIVVVSAVGGVTDELFRLSDLALAGEDWGAAFDAISMQHREILGALELEPTLIDDLLDELEFLAGGIASLRELTARTCDRLVSFGERMSCRIVSAHLQSIGVASEPFDAFDVGLVTDSRFGCARPLPGTAERIRNALFEADGVPVITGYIGKNENGVITTLRSEPRRSRSGPTSTAS